MSTRILFIEDCADDVALAIDALRRAGLSFEERIVTTFPELEPALDDGPWSAIISDYNLVGFTGLVALRLVRERHAAVPFVLLSGTIGEERAAEVMRLGANDYVMKDRIERLPSVLRRELDAAAAREEHRRLEESLRHAEERYRLTFEQAPLGIANTDREGRFVSVNARLCAILGRTSEELLGRRFVDFSHADDAANALTILRELLDGTRATARFDRRYLRKDGSAAWTNVALSPMRAQNGEIATIIVLVEDISEQKHAEEELRRRAVLQSAVANLGQLALSGASVDFLLMQSAISLRNVLDVDLSEVLQRKASDFVLVAGAGWDDHEIGISKPGPGSQASFTVDAAMPVIVEDIAAEDRFVPSELLVKKAIVSGLTVTISSGDGTAWGVLGVHARRKRRFTAYEIDFLRSVATVLGQAIDRAQSDAEVRTRARQQSAIASLGRLVLTSLDSDVLDHACELLRIGVAADYAFLVELSGDTLRHRGGQVWHDGLPHEIAVRATAQSGLTILSGEPVLVDDYRTDDRFDTYDATVPHGILSGVMVPIASAARTFGVLSAQSRTARHFRPEDIDFLQAIANMLAEAMEREAARAAVLHAMSERERVTRNLELLLESTVEGIYTIDLDGRCTMVNRAAAAFLGLEPHELLGERVHDLLHPFKPDGSPLPVEECAVHDVLRTGEPRTVTNDVFRRKDNLPIPVAYSAAPIVDGDRLVGAVVTFTDLTERRKLELRLEQANRLSSLGRLAATIAHEFNNVLMGIAPFVEVVRRAPSPQKVATSLDHIASSVKRGRRITQDILRFTQPAEPVRAAVAVRAWLNSVAIEARSLLPPQYEVAIDAQALSVDADANQLHQIFTNLIFNARDAMPEGGTIRLQARRERDDARFPFGCVEQPSRYAHFSVSDSGSGISAETLRHIFEPLFTTKKNGTGLGLPVTHQVVQRHGGEIFVESSEGAGTTFHIFLPLSTASEAAVPEPASETPQKRAARQILLVEDDPTVAAGLTALLEYEGFSVIAATTGNEALDTLRQITPDAVVLDVGLPDMDGQRVYAGIAAMHPMLPVVFSTGHAERGRLEELLVKPNVHYLLKPYEADVLMEALARVMSAAACESTP
jgi:PAS domain S-box-containing protein